MAKTKIDVDPVRLRLLYEDGFGSTKIAKEMGISSCTVLSRLKLNGILVRKNKCGNNAISAGLDGSWLRKRYLEDGVSTKDMAIEAGVSQKTISVHLTRIGVLRRAGDVIRSKVMSVNKRIDATWLRNQYEINRRTAQDIGQEIGISHSTVRKRLIVMGVKIRTPYSYGCCEISTPHRNILIPLLDKLGILHTTSYVLPKLDGQVKSAHPYEIDEYLPNHNVFLDLYGDYWHGRINKNSQTAKKVDADRRRAKIIAENYPSIKRVVVWESELKNGIGEAKICKSCGINS